MKLETESYTITPPIFQPLRLWTSREADRAVSGANSGVIKKTVPARDFAIRGGFGGKPTGERRMILVGKLIRSRAV